MYENGVGSYRQTDVLTADPKRLVIMCYERTIDSLKFAKEKFLAGEHEAKAKAVDKKADRAVFTVAVSDATRLDGVPGVAGRNQARNRTIDQSREPVALEDLLQDLAALPRLDGKVVLEQGWDGGAETGCIQSGELARLGSGSEEDGHQHLATHGQRDEGPDPACQGTGGKLREGAGALEFGVDHVGVALSRLGEGAWHESRCEDIRRNREVREPQLSPVRVREDLAQRTA